MTARVRSGNEVLTAIRQQEGLTQEKAADRAGIRRQAWNHIENDRRGIGPKTAGKLAATYGGDPGDYLTAPPRVRVALTAELTVLRQLVGAQAAALEELSDDVDDRFDALGGRVSALESFRAQPQGRPRS